MLLDTHGHAIQANMDVKDNGYFSQLLQPENAYRISRFSCEETKKWEQTIDNKTPLIFGRYIHVQSIPATDFPERYFKFENELEQRADVKTAFLKESVDESHSPLKQESTSTEKESA